MPEGVIDILCAQVAEVVSQFIRFRQCWIIMCAVALALERDRKILFHCIVIVSQELKKFDEGRADL